MLLSVIMIGTTVGTTNAQSEDTPPNTDNGTGNGTTGAVVNLTNASSSLEDARNMSVIEGTMNQTN